MKLSTNLFKRKENKISYKNVTCANCGTKFDGKFCPECGQSVTDYDKPFTFIIYTFMGDFFAFDTRFFHTIAALLFKPGFLSKEYIEGRRVKYAPPFRIFIFVSFILFLLLQVYSNRGLNKILGTSLNNEKGMILDSSISTFSDSIYYTVASNIDSETTANDTIHNQFDIGFDSDKSGGVILNYNNDSLSDYDNLQQKLSSYANQFEKRLKRETDPEKRDILKRLIYLFRSPNQLVSKVLKYLSWAFFLLLPIFAFILKLAYIRRKYNYMRHLVFSIHIHTFVFVVLTVLVALHLIFSNLPAIIPFILVLLMPLYFIIALKKFYGQRMIKVLLKFLFVSVVYNIVFIVLIWFVFVDAFKTI